MSLSRRTRSTDTTAGTTAGDPLAGDVADQEMPVEGDGRAAVRASSSYTSEGPTYTGARSIVPATGLGLVGASILLIGAWAGIVAFVGPVFGFAGDGSTSWYWNLPHALLWLVPGAVATVCGLLLLRHVPRALAGEARGASALEGMLVVLAGAWLVFGWLVWPVLEHTGGVFVPASATRALEFQAGYSLGPGVVLCVLGAFVVGRTLAPRRAAAMTRSANRVAQTSTIAA